MKRGISFKVSQNRYHILSDILKNIDVQQYIWHSVDSQSEAWCYKNGEESDFLENQDYTGKEFLYEISQRHCILSIKLQAYKSEYSGNREIFTYEEFKESDCYLLLLIYDYEYIEIYAKEQHDIDLLMSNARKSNFTDIDYITDANDCRNNMNVR